MSPAHAQLTASSPGQTAAADQRLDEVAGLLAAGILRQRLRHLAGFGEPQKILENGLDAGARKSVHLSRT